MSLKYTSNSVTVKWSIWVTSKASLLSENPEGEKGTVTTGIVSANRGPFLLFSAPISPGSSGSPILDEDGYVVGVVKGFRKDSESQNMNLAVATSNIGNESANFAGHSK
jgi:S1-C subfamily serine protease